MFPCLNHKLKWQCAILRTVNLSAMAQHNPSSEEGACPAYIWANSPTSHTYESPTRESMWWPSFLARFSLSALGMLTRRRHKAECEHGQFMNDFISTYLLPIVIVAGCRVTQKKDRIAIISKAWRQAQTQDVWLLEDLPCAGIETPMNRRMKT